MNTYLMACVSVALGPTLALAGKLPVPPSKLPTEMQVQGAPLKNTVKCCLAR